MKTGLKLGIVALSLVAMATTICTQTVKANTSAEVKVTVIEGENNCDPMSGYVWENISASISDTTLTGITNPLHCVLLRDAASAITFTLTNLSGATVSQNIANSQFTIGANTGTFLGSLTTGAAYGPTEYDAGGTFYTKIIHEVGEFTKDITISGSVPAGTPVDTYAGELNIVVPNTATP